MFVSSVWQSASLFTRVISGRAQIWSDLRMHFKYCLKSPIWYMVQHTITQCVARCIQCQPCVSQWQLKRAVGLTCARPKSHSRKNAPRPDSEREQSVSRSFITLREMRREPRNKIKPHFLSGNKGFLVTRWGSFCAPINATPLTKNKESLLSRFTFCVLKEKTIVCEK